MNEANFRAFARQACYGIPADEIARRCCVDVATARRWKRGATRPSQAAVMILLDDLGSFDPAWKGWRIRNGALVSPEGWAVTQNDVLALPLMRAQLAGYQRDERIAKAQLEALEEQPQPGVDWKLEQAFRGQST